MELSVMDSIANMFNSFLENPLEKLLPFLIGIIFGFVLCLLIYLLIVVSSLKKTKNSALDIVLNVEDEIIERQIENARNKYIEESLYKSTAQKTVCLKDACWDLMNDIAAVYYPDAKYPLYELSIDELIMLVNYISERVDSLFKGVVLKKIKKLKVSTILKMLDMKKKIDENAVIKAANKHEVPKKIKFVTAILQSLNPIYWVKKIMIDGTFNIVINKIALTIIDVVGEETSNIYSKSVFVRNEENEDISKELKEIEGLIEGDKNEK